MGTRKVKCEGVRDARGEGAWSLSRARGTVQGGGRGWLGRGGQRGEEHGVKVGMGVW